MDFTNFRRVFLSGVKNFARGGAVSFATVLIMTVTLSIIAALIFLSAILSHTVSTIEQKVDVNVYFVTDASENEILRVRDQLDALPEVATVEYTSRDEALAAFRERHKEDALTLQALDELGENPLGASLAIKAYDPSQYEGIVEYLTERSAAAGDNSIIDRVNYFQNKIVIERLTSAIATTERAGLAIALVFAAASIIITLATIRLAIHSSRDEIAVMRLVGASNMYVRGPFIVAGMLAGVLGSVLALVLFYPVAWYAGTKYATWLGGFDLFEYYASNFPMIFLILVGSGLVLGALASYLAVRRYLKV